LWKERSNRNLIDTTSTNNLVKNLPAGAKDGAYHHRIAKKFFEGKYDMITYDGWDCMADERDVSARDPSQIIAKCHNKKIALLGYLHP